ncbi:hypothetical protein T492DRAFT_888262 [Pavlovales sp. CCMP2436]|nr:hypothetical protein T492DRAFT_888262 [Pavlovales sp. CCMP2436]
MSKFGKIAKAHEPAPSKPAKQSGLSRKAQALVDKRWERAKELQLDPPTDVKTTMEVPGVEPESIFTRSLSRA